MCPAPGEVLLHYEIERKLGEGGMGEVWLAKDSRLQRPVALKFLARKAALEPEARERLAREARAASALNHPNILTIYAVESVGDMAFIAMEYADGLPLDEWVAKRRPSLEQLLDLAEQIGDGLGAAHGKGIIHRDVKPSNVMVSESGRAQVMDFGLAKVSTEPQLTQTGSTLGTLAYMSPEQVKGQEVDPRSDQFSFGALLYELVDGKSPFARPESAGAVLNAILNDPPAPLSKSHPEVPLELDRVLAQALAKDRDERYPDLAAMLVDLRAMRSQQPVSAPPLTRNSLSLPVLALISIAAIAALWFAVRDEGSPFPGQVPSDAPPNAVLVSTVPPTQPAFEEPPARYGQRLLSNLRGSPHSATMETDGNLVAYVNPFKGVDQLFVTGIDDGEPRRLTSVERSVQRPRWQPGGNLILFQHTPSGENWADGEVFTISALGGTPRRWLDKARGASWSPDGTRIVFEREQRIWIADADGQNQRVLDKLPPSNNPVILQMPALAPDGNRVAFVRSELGPEGGLWIANLDGSGLRPLSDADSAGQPNDPSFTPDGRWVVYSSELSGPRLLWRVSTAAGGPFPPQPITTGTGADSEPCVAQGGKRILFTNARTESVVQVWDPTRADSAPRILRSSRSSLLFPTWSPLGDRIAAYGEGRQGDAQILTLDADGSNLLQLTSADAADAILMPCWSADGEDLYFYQESGPAPGLCRMPTAGGPVEVVSSTWRMETHPFPTASADGRYIVAMKLNPTGLPGSVQLDLESGQETPFSPVVFRADFSETGDMIVGEWPPGIITLVDTATKARTSLGKGQVARFAGDGLSIYFLVSEHGSWELWAVDLSGENRRRLGNLGQMYDLSPWIDVSRYGEVVWTERRSSPTELWVLEQE